MPRPKPVLLLILDGWGEREDPTDNAIAQARLPNWRRLLADCPHTLVHTEGRHVGLPDGQMGNSEVGHTNMGAGRVIYQDLTRINLAIEDESFSTNAVLVSSMDRARRANGALHLLGLVSDGGVHSHVAHLRALLRLARTAGVRRVYVHAFTDGRDTSPRSARELLNALAEYLADSRLGRIASVCGRYWAMDRDRRWERTQRALDAITGSSSDVGRDPEAVLSASYAANVTDEFVQPTVIVDAENQPVGALQRGDSVICFNFRADRVRQMTRAITATVPELVRQPLVADYTCLTQYDATFDLPVAFAPQEFARHLGEELSRHKLTNLRLAETEKYAHVTYFFNCGYETPYAFEDRLLIPSPKVPTYDLQPQMSAPEIATALIDDVQRGNHKVVICNFANADMVGHTGNFDATVQAVEVLDKCLGQIASAVFAAEGSLLVTSDHGNCEQMWDDARGLPHTAHTSNPVPFILAHGEKSRELREGGALCDVAPTILELLGLAQPAEMTGRSLLK
jgi:2,3-bisphosphoglycerate-independent phosphoglycerate mutase